MKAVEGSLRLDKWLWFARIARTRTLAAKLVRAGKVRVNRERSANPARPVHVGDVLTVARERDILVYEIAALGERRGPYSQALLLYNDLSPPKADPGVTLPLDRSPRPGKRQRRELSRLRGKNY